MEDNKIIEKFFEIIKNIGDYEDLYLKTLVIDMKKLEIRHSELNKKYLLTQEDIIIINLLQYIPIEKLNIYTNELRKKDDFIKYLKNKENREIKQQLKNDNFEEEYQKWLNSIE